MEDKALTCAVVRALYNDLRQNIEREVSHLSDANNPVFVCVYLCECQEVKLLESEKLRRGLPS